MRRLFGRRELRYRSFWLAVGWLAVVLVVTLSLAPAPDMPDIPHLDKLQHGLVYFILAAWFGQLYPGRWQPALGLLLLGGGIEFLQGMTGYRDMSLGDLGANTVGVVLGSLLSVARPTLLLRAEAWLIR